jgi:hypothetical protein
MLGVVLARQLGRYAEHPHGDKVQTFVLEPREHSADETTLHTIRLEQYEGAFHE